MDASQSYSTDDTSLNAGFLVFSVVVGATLLIGFVWILFLFLRISTLRHEFRSSHYMTLPIYNPSTETVTEKTIHVHALLLATVQLLQNLTNSTDMRVAIPESEIYTITRAFLHKIVGTEVHSVQAYAPKPLVDV